MSHSQSIQLEMIKATELSFSDFFFFQLDEPKTILLPKHEERCVTTLKRLRKIILKSSKKLVACNVPYFLPCQRVESQNDMHSSLPFSFIKQHFDRVHDEPLEPAAVCCVCIVQRYFKRQTRPTPLVFDSSHDALLFTNKQISFLDFATL